MPSSSALAVEPPVAAVAAAPHAAILTVGACDLCEKDLVLLRSLLRLLDGADGLHLVFSESLEACGVVFVSARHARPSRRLPSGGVVVRVVDPADDDAAGPDLRVHAPLRSCNVGAVLRQAAAQVGPPAAQGRGLVDLFHVIAHHFTVRDRGVTAVPIEGHGVLVLDFETRIAHGTLPLPMLLAGAYGLGMPVRATPALRDVATTLPPQPIGELFWRAAQRLGDDGRADTPMSGRWRLTRWPAAVALSRPGMPRLAALLTSRPLSCAEAAAASGLTEPVVHWFLQAALAQGLARPCNGDAPPAPAPSAPNSLFGRLRQHLKLW